MEKISETSNLFYKNVEHLIHQQAKMEKEILEEFASDEFSIDHPLIKVNPYGINPLSALILFRTETEKPVTVKIIGKTEHSSFSKTFPASKEHIIPVVGLYENYTNRVELQVYQSDVVEHLIDIGSVLPERNILHSMETSIEYLQDNLIFLSPALQSLPNPYPFGFDHNGEVRWLLNIHCLDDLKRLSNGNFLISSDRLCEEPYYMMGLYELHPVGKIYREYRLPDQYHHDAIELKDGNLLAATNDCYPEAVEDACVLLDRETGKILRKWNYTDTIEKTRVSGSKSWTVEDWCHNNAIFYDEKTHSITFSARHFDGIVNMDFESGKLNWILGDPTDWPEDLVNKYFFTPIGKDFEWPYGQHSARITENGDVMCFDNHYRGAKRAQDHIPAEKNYSRGVRYRINTDDMTIEQVWQYGRDLGAKYYATYISNVEVYKDDWYMVHFGGIVSKEGKATDYSGLGVLKHHAELDDRTIEYCYGKKMLELHVRGNFFRAEKMTLYSNQDELVLGKGQILGSLSKTSETALPVVISKCKATLPANVSLVIQEEIDRFVIRGEYSGSEKLFIRLRDTEKDRYYDLPKSKLRPDIEHNMHFKTINKSSLAKDLKVGLVIGSIDYDCGLNINL